MLTKTEYSMEELVNLTGFSRAKILRIAKQNKFKTNQVKEGRVWKHYYSALDIDKYILPLMPNSEKETEVIPRKTKSKLVKLIESENQISSLNDVDEKVRKTAIAKWTLCRDLTFILTKYERAKNHAQGKRLQYSISDIYSNFIRVYPEKYKHIYEIIGGISEASLRRWLKDYDKDEPMKLIQGNQISKTKGVRLLTSDQRDAVHKLYLNPNKPTIAQVYKRMEGIYGLNFLSYETIRNYINKDVPQILKDKYRMGMKEFSDTYDTYVKRSYAPDSIMANDLWVSDGHDLEFMMRCPKGKITSGKIIVWQDMATRMWVSYTLVMEETTEAILNALRKGIEKYGKPRALYTDNGKAYRSEKTEQTYANLGLEVINAIPYNAKAKPIERTFRNFKESCAVWSKAYKGGHIMERPENLKSAVKYQADNIMDWRDVTEVLDQWMIWYNNQKHRGHGMNGRTPVERFEKECPVEIREHLPNDILYELFLYKDDRVVGQQGITFEKQGYRWENYQMYIGQKVSIKYDYDNISEVFVYTKEGKLIDVAKPVNMANFKDSIPQIKEAQRAKRSVKKALNKYHAALAESDTLNTMEIFWEDSIKPKQVKVSPQMIEQSKVKNSSITIELYERR